MKRFFTVLALSLACAMTLAAFTPVNALFGATEQTAVAAFCKNDGQGRIITFTKSDFTDRVSGEEQLSAIVVRQLPRGGVLRLAGLEVRSGEAIEADRLGALCFVPEIGKDVHTGFTFVPVFSRSGAGEQAVTVSLNISDTPNAAPIAVEGQFETYTDLPLTGTLKAVDADGDPCTFTLAESAKRGAVEVSGTGFSYDPCGKSGWDSFSVVATDGYGNRSRPAEVLVKVTKRHDKERFTYTDMTGDPAHFAALRLREEGVFSGESFGSEAFFDPEKPVSRAEFLTMAAVVADLAMPTAAVSTGLSDDQSIPAWAQSYVAAGLLSGVVQGSADGLGNRVFRAQDAITRAEAAAIVDRCLTLPDDGREMAFADREEVPAWAAQSVVNTTAGGLVPVFSDNTVRANAPVTRRDAALMLYAMLSK